MQFFPQLDADEAFELKICRHQKCPSFAGSEINKRVIAEVLHRQSAEGSAHAFWPRGQIGVVIWIGFPALACLVDTVGCGLCAVTKIKPPIFDIGIQFDQERHAGEIANRLTQHSDIDAIRDPASRNP